MIPSMRASCLAGGVLLLAACRGKSDADTAPEFVEKFTRACADKDMDTVWTMFSQDTQTLYSSSAQAVLENAKGNPTLAKRLKLDYDLAQEPDQIDAIAFAKIRLKKDHRTMLEAWGTARYASENKDSGNTVVTVEIAGRGREDWTLIREKRYLRFDRPTSRLLVR